MELADIEEVIEIDQLSFSNPWPKNSFRYEVLENKNSACWVAEIEISSIVKIIAMAVLWNIVDEIHIGTIAVHPDQRKQAIGVRFLRHILVEARKEGKERALLEVRQSNQNALNLYQKFGFRVDGIRKNYYHDNGENAVLMSASLVDNKYLDKLTPETDPIQRGGKR